MNSFSSLQVLATLYNCKMHARVRALKEHYERDSDESSIFVLIKANFPVNVL